MVDVLELRFDVSRPQHPRVDVVVNGRTSLDEDHDLGHDPDDLLDTGALLPREVPHRLALGACVCEGGCSRLTALVVAEGATTRWTDLTPDVHSYDGALPYGDLPDPLALGRRTPLSRVGELVFDADDYLRTVRTATEDRWWETHARAVARLARARLGWRSGVDGTVLAWDGEEDAVAVNARPDGVWGTHLVPIPPGTTERAAEALAALLAGADVPTLLGVRRLHL